VHRGLLDRPNRLAPAPQPRLGSHRPVPRSPATQNLHRAKTRGKAHMLEQRELIAYLEDELSPAEHARIERALPEEPAARSELQPQQQISRALAALLANDTANARLKQSILSVLRAHSPEQFKAQVLADTSELAARRQNERPQNEQ